MGQIGRDKFSRINKRTVRLFGLSEYSDYKRKKKLTQGRPNI